MAGTDIQLVAGLGNPGKNKRNSSCANYKEKKLKKI